MEYNCKMPLFQLSCAVQEYAWGKVGSTSSVATLAAANGDLKIDEGTSYAEYWFGTHAKGPAYVKGSGQEKQLLSDWLSTNGGESFQTGQLPYLLKVLSIAKCLSIQAHPNKALAEKLHSERPMVYKDPNHKPEMTIALTPFEAMCQFRSSEEIVAYAESVPEFKAVLGDSGTAAGQRLKTAETEAVRRTELKSLFSAYAKADAELVKLQVEKLVARVSGKGKDCDPAEEVAVRLASQFPGDIGVFAPFLLNVVQLQPGEAIFLAANEPHAYISGDCVEVMACSDNVVRMGCTPKLRDVEVLVEMLTYNSGKPKIMTGSKLNQHTRLYEPWDSAVTEFQIERTAFEDSESKTNSLRKVPGPSLLLVLQGSGVTSDGTPIGGTNGSQIYFLGGNETVTITEDDNSEDGKRLVIVRACEHFGVEIKD